MLVLKLSTALILRVSTLKKANITAPNRGISEVTLNTPMPGWRMISVPAKPISPATHWRGLTFSPSNNAARPMVSSGKIA
ncbi:hypothetical protein D3C73_1529070 [compost metagenome]